MQCPEVMQSQDVVYDQAADVFSYAMVLFEILTSSMPWEFAKDADEVFGRVEVGGRPPFKAHKGAPEILIRIMNLWQYLKFIILININYLPIEKIKLLLHGLGIFQLDKYN